MTSGQRQRSISELWERLCNIDLRSPALVHLKVFFDAVDGQGIAMRMRTARTLDESYGATIWSNHLRIRASRNTGLCNCVCTPCSPGDGFEISGAIRSVFTAQADRGAMADVLTAWVAFRVVLLIRCVIGPAAFP